MPSISFDVDGVLKKGNIAISRAKEAIIKLKDKGIPVSLITNDGGELESIRANKISNILKLEGQYKFIEKEMFMCHSPMKKLIQNYKNKLILISGVNTIAAVIENYGFKHYMTINEYATIYDEIAPIIRYTQTNEQRQIIIKNVEKRLNISVDNNPPQVHGIFILSEILNWEINTQVYYL